MNRRLFLQGAATLLLHSIHATQTSASPKIKWNREYTIPEMELVGRSRPTLYGDGFNLRKEAANAFDAMSAEAQKSGITMYSVSSYRSFEHQQRIWDRKYTTFRDEGKSPQEAIRAIIEYSTLPGSSRHHWGTDLDITDSAKPQPSDHPLIATHYHEGGVFAELFTWLLTYANTYGFYLTYTNDPARKGFAYEPWHWSYAPLSIPLLQQYKNVSLKDHISESNLQGKQYLTPEFLKLYKQQWGFGIAQTLLP
jgi:LAS superfamily LD-carboxypeptidase LdcB